MTILASRIRLLGEFLWRLVSGQPRFSLKKQRSRCVSNRLEPTQWIIRHLIEREDGQAMTEYAVIVMAMIVSFLAINGFLIPPITAASEFTARMMSFPFP